MASSHLYRTYGMPHLLVMCVYDPWNVLLVCRKSFAPRRLTTRLAYPDANPRNHTAGNLSSAGWPHKKTLTTPRPPRIIYPLPEGEEESKDDSPGSSASNNQHSIV